VQGANLVEEAAGFPRPGRRRVERKEGNCLRRRLAGGCAEAGFRAVFAHGPVHERHRIKAAPPEP